MIGPRIRGKVGQAEHPEDVKGKWFFEIWLTSIGGGDCDDSNSMGLFGPWETEEIAKAELTKCVKLAADEIERKHFGSTSGEYIDMRTNMRRKWDRSDEN